MSSIKGIGDKATQAITEIARQGKDNIVDIYISTNGTNLNGSVFRKMIRINYFKKYGSCLLYTSSKMQILKLLT